MNRLEVVSANPEQVLNGTMDREKPLSLRHGLEASHLTLLLPGTLVRDLGPVVLVLTRSMFNRWEDLTMGSGIAPESVGGQLPRSLTLALQHLAKETLSSPLISFLRHENIDHVTVLIHCLPKGVELSVDLDEDFVDKPVLAKSAPFPSQRPSKGWAELAAPVSNRLVGDNHAALSEQIFHFSQAQGKSMVQPERVTDDFRREAMASI